MLVATIQNEIVGNLTFVGGTKARTAHAGEIGVSVLANTGIRESRDTSSMLYFGGSSGTERSSS